MLCHVVSFEIPQGFRPARKLAAPVYFISEPNLRREFGMPLEFVLHSFRHTNTDALRAGGADAFTIQRVAGHHRITMSQRYLHPSRGTIEAGLERFEAVLPNQNGAAAKRVSPAKIATFGGKCDICCGSPEATSRKS
jgi:hypothetical protein